MEFEHNDHKPGCTRNGRIVRHDERYGTVRYRCNECRAVKSGPKGEGRKNTFGKRIKVQAITHWLHGMEQKDIAQRLNVPESTISSWIKRYCGEELKEIRFKKWNEALVNFRYPLKGGKRS